MADITNEHYNHLILNNIKDIYITSPLECMDKTFESFPKLFVDKMIYKRMNAHVQITAQLPKFNEYNKR